MTNHRIDVSHSGAVLLGPHVSCDGFHRNYRARIQTHVHLDHMDGFHTSKGFQDIFLTEATRQLLISEFNADLEHRQNIKIIKTEEPFLIEESIVSCIPNEHMLGALQVSVELKDGLRAGYSGDFQWPIPKTILVDALVVDSTYGSPSSIRSYSQAEAETRLLEIAVSKLKYGPLYIKAHRGTIQRALQVLSELQYPIIASPQFCKEVQVYREFGYPICTIYQDSCDEGKAAMQEGKYLRMYSKGDRFPVHFEAGTTIVLSAYMSAKDNPVLEYSERSVCVSLSDHADFNGTLEYIKATGAKYVITDNSRGGHACELAIEIKKQLGIEAYPSTNEMSLEWGT